MDPARLSDGEMGELERRLLEAARRDHVPDALSARMARGLGVQVADAATAAAGGAAGQLGAPLFAKVGLWGVLSLALVAAVAGWRAAQSATPSRAEAAHAMNTDRPAAPASAAALLSSSGKPSATDGAAQPFSPAKVSDARAPERGAGAFDDAALRAEIVLLDRARGALQRRASVHALRLLDQHRDRFAPARLAPEAAALRIEALVQRGAHAQASTLSRQFLSTYPIHPLSEHVAALTASPR